MCAGSLIQSKTGSPFTKISWVLYTANVHNNLCCFQWRACRTTSKDSLRLHAPYLAEANADEGHRQQWDAICVSSLQDEWETRHTLNHWTFHQLRHCYVAQLRHARQPLDQTWHCPSLSAWWLKMNIFNCLGTNTIHTLSPVSISRGDVRRDQHITIPCLRRFHMTQVVLVNSVNKTYKIDCDNLLSAH